MTNLYDLYKKVSDRHRRISEKVNVSEETLRLTEAMKSAAKSIIDKPTLKNVQSFRKAEWKWYKYSPEVRVKTEFHADTFESVIRSKEYYIHKPYFSQSAFGWAKKDGTVYCLTSTSRPNQVKIGACSEMPLHDRLKKLKGRYHKDDILTLEFAYDTNETSNLERALQNSLVHVTIKTKGTSSEWYFATPNKAKKELLRIAKEHGYEVKKIRNNYLKQSMF